jgi:hypothetical protein
MNPSSRAVPAGSGEPPSWTAVAIIWAVVAAVGGSIYLIRAATARNREEQIAAKLDAPVSSLEADALYATYAENSVRADRLFKGQAVEVKGIVNSIGSDLLDAPYIGIGKGLTGGVQCRFPKSRSGKVANVVRGGKVTVRGIVNGLTAIGAVDLTDCLIVPGD